MALYPDVPAWVRITNGVGKRQSPAANSDAYYRSHQSELAQEMREIESLERAGEIPTDTHTMLGNRIWASRKKWQERAKNKEHTNG